MKVLERQSHDDLLCRTSLQLVGKASTIASPIQVMSDLPWDEADLQQKLEQQSEPSQPHKECCSSSDSTITMNDAISFDNLSKPDESRWRSHGAAKRKQLLDEDQAKGGRTFQLKFETSVHRYFTVAHWALEQFHELYQSGSDLEETYVMGYRIVSFLTECLPHHPGLRSAPDIRQRARSELDLLRKCLEDVALQIDEETCNNFADDFDPLGIIGDDEDDDSVSETTSPSQSVGTSTPGDASKNKHRMVRFEDWHAFPEDEKDWQRESSESPSAETVGTTGTGSVETTDLGRMSTAEEDSPLRPHSIERHNVDLNTTVEVDQIVLEDDEEDLDAAFPSLHNHYFRRHVQLDFLEQISREEVPYETDSEAADSWAQTPNDVHPLAPSSSGVSPTCDPARIAFRELMNRLRQQATLQNLEKNQLLRHDERRKPRLVGREQHSEDVQVYLATEEDEDATSVVESCRESLNSKAMPSTELQSSPFSSSSSVLSSGSSLEQRDETSAFAPYNRQGTANTKANNKSPLKSLLEKNFLDDNDWISFDATNSQSANFFQLD